MEVVTYTDPAEYQGAVFQWLTKDVARNSSILAQYSRLFDSKATSSLFLGTVAKKKKKNAIVLAAFQYSAWHGMHIVAANGTNKATIKAAVSELVTHLIEKDVPVMEFVMCTAAADACIATLDELDENPWKTSLFQNGACLSAKKAKKPSVLAPGKLQLLTPDESDGYAPLFHQFALEEWRDDAPTILQCSESLGAAAMRKQAYGLFYKDFLVCLAVVRSLPNDTIMFTNITTPHPYRNRGFAEALIHHVMVSTQQLFGAKQWLVHTEAGDPAMAVYSRLGFSEASTFEVHAVVSTALSSVGGRSLNRTRSSKYSLGHSQLSVQDYGTRSRRMSRQRRGSQDSVSSTSQDGSRRGLHAGPLPMDEQSIPREKKVMSVVPEEGSTFASQINSHAVSRTGSPDTQQSDEGRMTPLVPRKVSSNSVGNPALKELLRSIDDEFADDDAGTDASADEADEVSSTGSSLGDHDGLDGDGDGDGNDDDGDAVSHHTSASEGDL